MREKEGDTNLCIVGGDEEVPDELLHQCLDVWDIIGAFNQLHLLLKHHPLQGERILVGRQSN